MQTNLYNQKGEKVGTVNLPDSVFGVAWNATLVHQALIAQQANRRTPIAHTKDRSEVRGGGRKPWRQKGTGRARHGSTRSPLWSGGGVTFGPRNERDFSQKVNKKMKRKALFSALSQRLRLDELRVVEALRSESGKTKEFSGVVAAVTKQSRPNALVIASANDAGTTRASLNLPGVKLLLADSLNVEDVLRFRHILLEKGAVDIIERHYPLGSRASVSQRPAKKTAK